MESNQLVEEFSFFIPATFEKGKGKNELMRIKGIASSLAEDTDGETLDPAGFDLTPLLTKGFFNWDHQAKKTASAIIGEPDFAKIVNNGKQLYVEGFLYADSSEAQATYDLAVVLEKNSPTRRLGFSIEGQVIEKDPLNPKWIKKARITSIAITPMPKNPNTLLQVMKGETSHPLMTSEYEVDVVKGGVGSGTYDHHKKMAAYHEAKDKEAWDMYEDAHTSSDPEISGKLADKYKKASDFHGQKREEHNNKAKQLHDPKKHGSFYANKMTHEEAIAYGEGSVSKAMSAEGMSEDGLIAEHIAGTKNPNQTPLKGSEGVCTCSSSTYGEDNKSVCKACGGSTTVASPLKKSEVYNLIADKYTTDPVVAQRIFSLIENVNQKLFHMTTITKESVDKAFEFLSKAVEPDFKGKETVKKKDDDDDTNEDADDMEKATSACKSMMEKGVKEDELEGELKKAGFSETTASSAAQSCIAEASANKDGGTITVAKGEENELGKTSNIEELIKGLTSNVIEHSNKKFQAIGTLLQFVSQENSLLKGELAELRGEVNKIGSTSLGRKSITATGIEKPGFEKGQEGAPLAGVPAGAEVFDLSKGADVQALGSRLYSEALSAQTSNRPDAIMERIVANFEIAKSIDGQALNYLKTKNIYVTRTAQ